MIARRHGLVLRPDVGDPTRRSRRAEREACERRATGCNASERNEAIGDGSAARCGHQRPVEGLASGLVLGVLAALVVACRGQVPDLPPRPEKIQLINGLWLQIRGWRSELRMELDPSPTTELQYHSKTVTQAKAVCPDAQPIAPTCGDTCVLAEHICDNAETICSIADELGKDDAPAQDKCASAKASCREAKQRCCNCNASPPGAP